MEKRLTKQEKDILFGDFPESKEFDRKIIEKYSQNSRDVHIANGKYYTSKEMDERAKEAFSVKLY